MLFCAPGGKNGSGWSGRGSALSGPVPNPGPRGGELGSQGGGADQLVARRTKLAVACSTSCRHSPQPGHLIFTQRLRRRIRRLR